MKERILYYELWVISVVFNFQRERVIAGVKERSCSWYGERQRWGKIHCGEKSKMDWRVICDTVLLRGGCHHATKTRKPRSWRILYKRLAVTQTQSNGPLHFIHPSYSVLRTQCKLVGTKMLEEGSSNSKSQLLERMRGGQGNPNTGCLCSKTKDHFISISLKV